MREDRSWKSAISRFLQPSGIFVFLTSRKTLLCFHSRTSYFGPAVDMYWNWYHMRHSRAFSSPPSHCTSLSAFFLPPATRSRARNNLIFWIPHENKAPLGSSFVGIRFSVPINYVSLFFFHLHREDTFTDDLNFSINSSIRLIKFENKSERDIWIWMNALISSSTPTRRIQCVRGLMEEGRERANGANLFYAVKAFIRPMDGAFLRTWNRGWYECCNRHTPLDRLKPSSIC